MSEFKEGYLLSRQEYGCLYPYLMMDKVQQVFWNGRGLWIEDEDQGRHLVTDRPDENFVDRFAMLISNRCKCAFNRTHPVMEWEGDAFSIQLIHESMAVHGTTILLKKMKKPVRLSAGELMEKGLCRENAIPIFKEIIQEKQSFIITGVYGCGMEELLMFMTRYFSPEERVAAVCSDHLSDPAVVNPDKDFTTIRVKDNDNTEQVGNCLRGMSPDCVLALCPDVPLMTEVLRMNEQYGVQIGIMNYTGVRVDRKSIRSIPDTVAGQLFAGEESEMISYAKRAIKEHISKWIIMDEKGLGVIVDVNADSDGFEIKTCYERK